MNITFAGQNVHLYGQQLKVGDKLNDFTLTDAKLRDVESSNLKGNKVFLTFPSVDTTVCSLELLVLNDKISDIDTIDFYGVSMDLPFTQERWVKQNAGDFITMLSDHKFRTFGEITGTYIEELAVLARAIFVLNESNEVIYVQYVPEVSDEPDYDKLFVFIGTL